MPLQYSSIVEEVMAVRSSAGLFDISHMGRLWIRGKDAKQKLDFLTTRKLFGLELQEKGVPREGYEIEINRREIGVVSSGTFSPTLKKGIALCFVDREYLREGAGVELVIREKPVRLLTVIAFLLFSTFFCIIGLD